VEQAGGAMTELSVQQLLNSGTVALRDMVCSGACRHKSIEECSQGTHLVFPYRGVYVRHLGRSDAVAEANQVLFFNDTEAYTISHPVAGGDACLSVTIDEPLLREIVPKGHLHADSRPRFREHRLRVDARAQALVALLRHRLTRGVAETLEAESLTLTLVRRALGESTSHAVRGTAGRRKLADRAKLVLTSDLAQRWTLRDIGREIGVSPVYLTQVFQQVEGMPLYRYQLQLRLGRALDLLGEYDDLTRLSLDLGFSSHSHFTSAFRRVYGRTPTDFRGSYGRPGS
jgi:AraC family transcriptional regulator